MTEITAKGDPYRNPVPLLLRVEPEAHDALRFTIERAEEEPPGGGRLSMSMVVGLEDAGYVGKLLRGLAE